MYLHKILRLLDCMVFLNFLFVNLLFVSIKSNISLFTFAYSRGQTASLCCEFLLCNRLNHLQEVPQGCHSTMYASLIQRSERYYSLYIFSELFLNSWTCIISCCIFNRSKCFLHFSVRSKLGPCINWLS
ncbi:unnamed protein product [Moneuplotes crassus]|uniref:Uncharacterized protein n=1 Tax=Euplotes crassus TaxID=5936 RepID=A0AAD1XPN8_EUPCR|nr:unnamed protein product [Moneuplotes crassus]